MLIPVEELAYPNTHAMLASQGQNTLKNAQISSSILKEDHPYAEDPPRTYCQFEFELPDVILKYVSAESPFPDGEESPM